MRRSIKSKLLVTLFASSMVAACQPAAETKQAVEEKPTAKPVAKVLSISEIADTITERWQGDYNNDAQIAALREDGAPIWQQNSVEDGEEPTFGGHLPVKSYYRKVDMPAFGEHVIYLEEFIFKDRPYRQRIYTVIQDADANTVRVKLWNFKDKTTHAGAWKDISIIKDLTPEDMRPLPDICDLYTEQGPDGRLVMKMPKNKCKFGDTIYDYKVSLGTDDYWFRDRIVDAKTMNVKVTAGSFQYHILDKVN